MNKKVNLLLCVSVYLIMALFLGTSQSFALQEHGHKSPHDGEVRTMGDYHIEFLVAEGHDEKDYIVIYLLNKDLETIPVGKNVEGVVYLTFPDKTKKTLKLIVTSEPLSDEHGNHDEGHEDEEKHDEHDDGSKVEDYKNGENEIENISYLRAEIDLGSIDNFKAVVSIKIDQTRKNLRFTYTKEEHGEADEH